MISVLIVDDHPVVRDGLRSMLSADGRFEVVGEAGDGKRAVAEAARLRPDVVLMDLRMPEGDGVTAIRELSRQQVPVRVLVLTTYDTDHDVLLAIDAGATGYLLKDTPREELFRAVEAASRGESVLSPSVTSRLMGQMRQPPAETPSPRELDVLRLIAGGATNREVAKRLYISETTVKTHLLHVYARLGVHDRAAAVAAAFSRGYLTPPGR
ncbi:response regulator [Pseudactinotalea suaedae]|uniref:response regulator n=1 Tax=Pseudactinotalea suaedae TaxID=1524924 RepID=UPI0012E31E4E|nr:response regulator transcription factor [Pseudactinotalea suaedae]